MKKKFMVLAITAFMGLCLFGCGIDSINIDDSAKTVKDESGKNKDKDSKKKDKDKEDNKDKDAKKDSKDKEKNKDSKDDKKGSKDDDVKLLPEDEYWTVDDDDIFTVTDEDESRYDEYVSKDYYDEENGVITLCNYDGKKLMELNVPEGFVVSFASEKGTCFDLANKSKSYDTISIDNSESLYLADYLRDGMLPPEEDATDYKVDYKEYEAGRVKYLIATEEYYSVHFGDSCKYYYILIPYIDEKTTEYISIAFVVSRDEAELEKLALEFIGE